jgi:5-methylcytosine-specific restriction endonuclease McrA
MPLIKERKRKHKEEMRSWVRELKSTTPCADCQLLFPYYVMDFDHVTDDKEKAISVAMNQGWSKSKLEEEIAKCELVCANCHRQRTHQRSIV